MVAVLLFALHFFLDKNLFISNNRKTGNLLTLIRRVMLRSGQQYRGQDWLESSGLDA